MMLLQTFYKTIIIFYSFFLMTSLCFAIDQAGPYQIQTLRAAIHDLIDTYGPKYPLGQEFLEHLDILQESSDYSEPQWQRNFQQLQQEALLSNPLLRGKKILLIKRKKKTQKEARAHYAAHNSNLNYGRNIWVSNAPGRLFGFPSNHECNSSLERLGYDNEIAVLYPLRPNGKLTTLYRPDNGGYVGEVDLHWDTDRFLFTQSDKENWKIWQIGADGKGLTQISRAPEDVDCMDACYTPDGRIVFGSTASYQSVPCWHGIRRVLNLYSMNADGSGMQQLCFDQDHDFHASILNNGQIIFNRWDYTGISHIFLRELMVMNPDGTFQRAIYGSNSWFPNSLYFPRALPGSNNKLICILSGYHGVHRMGQLVLIDTNQGWFETDGLIQRISGRNQKINPMIRDNLVDQDWPKFLHPYPLNDKYFLVSGWLDEKSNWGIYLADVFDNLTLVYEDPDYGLFEPIPLQKRPIPPAIPDRTDPTQKEGIVYLQDIYAGPGLAGVPKGTIKSLRVIAYHFGYRGLAGPDKIGRGGPWEVMRILGTVPIEDDGSAIFRVPAKTPLSIQPLDREGNAVQLMRSWFTAMPGEKVSCVGCHERPSDAPLKKMSFAALREPREIEPWYGPPRGFDFEREVQPVLNRHCVECHDGRSNVPLDLRPASAFPNYRGLPLSKLGHDRLHPKMLEDTNAFVKYTPAYDALLPYVRRVGIEDDVSLLVPGEYQADTSPLIQLLAKGHQGVELDGESWDRLVTWIDLNCPCHGTWGDVYPIPDNAHERRMELRKMYGGPEEDPEIIPNMPHQTEHAVLQLSTLQTETKDMFASLADSTTIKEIQPQPVELETKTITHPSGIQIKMVKIPAGEFIMGDENGEPDEYPCQTVKIENPFWMSTCEITNEQFKLFDPAHDSRYYTKRHARTDDRGLPLDQPDQPVVRVSWEEAMDYCRWLSKQTGLHFTLPTEAQWEYACRAGTATPFHFGTRDADPSKWANTADKLFSYGMIKNGKQITGGLEHLVLEGSIMCNPQFNDQSVVTAPAATYQPNPWGLFDMHGNAAEWTSSFYQKYGNLFKEGNERKVVRGGSFFDNLNRCRSAYRLSYPKWRKVFNVGFRVVCE